MVRSCLLVDDFCGGDVLLDLLGGALGVVVRGEMLAGGRLLLPVGGNGALAVLLGYGFSDCQLFRESYGSVAYGLIPFPHGNEMQNLETKHGHDERILLEHLVFQTSAATAIAQRIGSLSPTVLRDIHE